MFSFNSNGFFQNQSVYNHFVSSFSNQHVSGFSFSNIQQNLISFESTSQIQSQQSFVQVFFSSFSISSVSVQNSNQISKKKMSNAIAKYHTQFFKTLKGTKKTFKIECMIVFEIGVSTILEKTITQTDQEFEMNVISKHFFRHLRLSLNKFFDIDFENLIMRTTNHRNISLKY